MLTQVSGAFLRGVAVMVMIAVPSALVPGTSADTQQMAALVALMAGLLVFAEYAATYPSLIEFRDAPPYNRIRFAMLCAMVVFASVAIREVQQPSTLGLLLEALAFVCGRALDFPYSPVRLLTLMLSEGADGATAEKVRSAAGIVYLVALVSLLGFVCALRLRRWPSKYGAFNVWVNLPTFDPTAGEDVAARLERDAYVNLFLGLVLPFVIPAVMATGGIGLGLIDMAAAQSLIWAVVAWAFLPASLVMRGIAMGRIAAMIRDQRRAGPGGAAELAAA